MTTEQFESQHAAAVSAMDKLIDNIIGFKAKSTQAQAHKELTFANLKMIAEYLTAAKDFIETIENEPEPEPEPEPETQTTVVRQQWRTTYLSTDAQREQVREGGRNANALSGLYGDGGSRRLGELLEIFGRRTRFV